MLTSWKESYDHLDSILKSRDITLPKNIHIVKTMVFLAVMYGCESQTIKKAEHRRTNAFKMWCWERLLKVPWTARRSILNIHWKDWYWSCSANTLATWCLQPTHWKRPWCWERLRAWAEGLVIYIFIFVIVVQWLGRVWLCNPTDCNQPASPVLHYFPEFTQNPCPLSQWCHPTISSSVTPFSSCPQSFPASGSFPVSLLFASGGQSIGASASVSILPVNIQSWFPLELTGLII